MNWRLQVLAAHFKPKTAPQVLAGPFFRVTTSRIGRALAAIFAALL